MHHETERGRQPDVAVPSLRVLVIGEGAEGDVCDAFRTAMFIEPLRRLGVVVEYSRTRTDYAVPVGPEEFERQTADEVDQLLAKAAQADVIVLRRWYATHILCLDCGFAVLDAHAAATHAQETRHALGVAPDLAVRRLFERIERTPLAAGGPAVVYETDDDLLRLDPENAQTRAFRHERDLVERMIRRADLMTVSTPVLASRYAPLTTEVRVVRNAVVPDWYASPEAVRGGPPTAHAAADTRLCFYGSLGRLRDYRVCADSVQRVAAGRGTRVWLGAPTLPGHVAQVAHLFDEIQPFVIGVRSFARRLGELRPDIGLAPLIDTPFARAKSELHWLEYAMVGGVTVATRLPGGGPYDAIRDGVDGFLVERKSEWQRTLERLVASPQLRAEVAGEARRRVLAEYDVAVRALEWADAYRRAADVAGRGLDRVRDAQAPASRPTVGAGSPASGTRSERRRGRRLATAQPHVEASPMAATVPTPNSARAILDAYVAAQAFANRSPLRLWLGPVPARTASPIPGSQVDDTWVTIDSAGEPDLRHDVAFGLPFADGSVDAIEALNVFDRAGHMAPVLAAEAARVLRPGASIRVATPDRAAALARQRSLMYEGIDLVGSAARLPSLGAEALVGLLRDAGFVDVVSGAAGENVLVVATRR